MVFHVLSDKFIQILPHNEPLVSYTIHDAGYKYDIVFSFFAVIGIKNDLDNLLRNAK